MTGQGRIPVLQDPSCAASSTCIATGSPGSTTAPARPKTAWPCSRALRRWASTSSSRRRTCGPRCSTTKRPTCANAFDAMGNELVGARPARVALSSEHFFDDVVFQRLLDGEALPYPGGKAVLVEFPERGLSGAGGRSLLRSAREAPAPGARAPGALRAGVEGRFAPSTLCSTAARSSSSTSRRSPANTGSQPRAGGAKTARGGLLRRGLQRRAPGGGRRSGRRRNQTPRRARRHRRSRVPAERRPGSDPQRNSRRLTFARALLRAATS